MKTLESFNFEELVDYCAERMLKELMCGNFRSGVWLVCDAVLRWGKAQDEKEKLNKKKK